MGWTNPARYNGSSVHTNATALRDVWCAPRRGLVNTARGLAKSYGERRRGWNVRNMNPEKAEGLSSELQSALEPLLNAI